MHTVSIAKSTHCSDRPNLSTIFLRNTHYTLSYALLMSSFTALCPILPCRLFRIWCSISKATVVLSVMSLFGTKALWELEMTFRRTILRRLANILETILETMLLKLTGRYSVMRCGLFFFGISTIWVKFIFWRHLLENRIDRTTAVTSSPTICQYFLEKEMWHTIYAPVPLKVASETVLCEFHLQCMVVLRFFSFHL